MTNPAKAVTKQVQKLQVKTTPMYVISEALILELSQVSKNLEASFNLRVNSWSVELSEPISHMKKSIKFEKKTEGWVWVLWESTSGSLSEATNTK